MNSFRSSLIPDSYYSKYVFNQPITISQQETEQALTTSIKASQESTTPTTALSYQQLNLRKNLGCFLSKNVYNALQGFQQAKCLRPEGFLV